MSSPTPIFKLCSEFSPQGDQPKAIAALTENIANDVQHNVILGVTGSGKTFTMANVIARTGKPALIIAPNKTLAAQLFSEFKTMFPENAVEYFVSYYDFYQPEAYLPVTDTYIQKDSAVNEMIDKMRHSATRSVLSRPDVIVVASVSCIYGLGAPEDYLAMRINIENQAELDRDKLLASLVEMRYERNDVDFHRGVFRVRGDRIEIFPAYEEDKAIRLDFFGDEIEAIAEIDPLRGTVIKQCSNITIFPASHYVMPKQTLKKSLDAIGRELKERINYFRDSHKLIEAQRIEERTFHDLEMLLEIGYCNGIENYSRYFSGRNPGEPPPTLLDYFPKDFLVFIDESHITVPQLRAMYRGDRSRKETLVGYGFRLPSALDNRPLKFEEFTQRINQVIYVSATPADYELDFLLKAKTAVIEQIVRPTGLIDPEIEVRPAERQVEDLLDEIAACVDKKQRVLITTLTKRMAEDLTEYYTDLGIKVKYLHADISTLERMDIIRQLRAGEFDVLVGINLLREGLDIPEVSLVAIMDADKEGFLRSARSLIQTCGRAARNINGKVIMYADKITGAIQQALEETHRRRIIQQQYNQTFNITPQTIRKQVCSIFETRDPAPTNSKANSTAQYSTPEQLEDHLQQLEAQMKKAAKNLEFEQAAILRDKIRELKHTALLL